VLFAKRRFSHAARLQVARWLGASDRKIPDDIVVVRDGRRIRVGPDLIYWNLYYGDGYETAISSIAARIVRPDDVVLDVGAGFGWYTTLFAQRLGPLGSVHAFEPVPTTHQKLLENVALNAVGDRVVTNLAAVGDVSGTVVVHVFRGESFALASVSSLGRSDYDKVEAPVVSLDRYLRDRRIDRVDLIKCDVEGCELKVLMGCAAVLSAEAPPIIMIELNERTSAAFAFTKEDLVRYLEAHGYNRFYDIVSGDRVRRIGAREQVRNLDFLVAAKHDAFERRASTQDVVIDDVSSR
jgi:FkbM family methyltransferase